MARKNKKRKTDAPVEEEGGEEKPKRRKRPIVLVVLIVAVLAVWKLVLGPAPAEDSAEAIDESAERVLEEGDIFPMEELVVNLADPGENRYLRVGLALVLEAGTSPESMDAEAPIAIDAAIDYLSAQTFEDLIQPGSKAQVREELSTRIRAAYDDAKVVRVLLTTFVMQ